jgi:hypothetical protein
MLKPITAVPHGLTGLTFSTYNNDTLCLYVYFVQKAILKARFYVKSPANYQNKGKDPNNGPRFLHYAGTLGLQHATKATRNQYTGMVEL